MNTPFLCRVHVRFGENEIKLVHRGVNSYTVLSNDFSRFWAG
jgi:hypothetical protein